MEVSPEETPNSTRWSSFVSRRLLPALAGAVIVAGLGIGGYLLGLSSGEDLENARATGVDVGQRQGAATGRRAGYRQGFRSGLDATFKAAYVHAYQKAFRSQFANAELKPPERIRVPATEAHR